jgi:hypothetical protein
MRMKLQEIGLVVSAISLIVSLCVGCTQQKSDTAAQTASAENPATQPSGFDSSRILRVRGVLRGHEGKRLTGIVGVVFAIYEQQEGGARLWQEVKNLQVDNRGHFTALVGSTTNGGIPLELFAAEKTRWLGEQVLLPGEVEQPRMRLVSTPEGLMAEGDPRLLIPAESGDQPAGAKADETIGPQQDQNQQTNRPSRARRPFHRRPMP